ncbi:MAG: type I restriction enzyme HsdR N-terminal domain-containing protein [Verrucomicrobiales bacterium]|nr:type I restriction enzyme HsdR N-terminal domain-containing protein [Verrucomicrobiales bacterium]
MRERFYEIPESTYLFPEHTSQNGARAKPEERVRQWCAFELIRAYGISVADIEFERQVKVGSKSYRIDILVSRCGKPWLVVECKERKDKKPEKSMAQAISYADAQSIRAEFVICTNGDYWWSRRHLRRDWVQIPDIPRGSIGDVDAPLTGILRGISDIAPVLHRMDDTLKEADAQRFLSALQRWFHGSSLLTEGITRELLWGLDNLLRVLSGAHDHINYCWGKLADAADGFDRWQKERGFSWPLTPVDPKGGISYAMQLLWADLLRIAESCAAVPSGDERALRVAVALLEYGQVQFAPRSRTSYPEINRNVHAALRDFLDHALAVHLNTKLPDPLDVTLVGEVRQLCSKAWMVARD